MNEGLIVDVNIYLKSIWEDMMVVVLVAPPATAESNKELSKDLVQDIASLTSAVAIVMRDPASLLKSHTQKYRGYDRVRSGPQGGKNRHKYNSSDIEGIHIPLAVEPALSFHLFLKSLNARAAFVG